MRFQSYFNTAIKIIGLFDGKIPLTHFLKNYFSQHKKHGSKDRKFITQACYNYYRIGCLLHILKNYERLKIAIFLCNENIVEWNILYDENWLQHHLPSLYQRIDFIQSQYENFSLKDIFAFTNELSSDVDENIFIPSHLIQPDVYLRIRSHKKQDVLDKLNQHKITYVEKFKDCVAIKNATSLNNIIKIDEEAMIQDYSSQRIREFFEIVQSATKNVQPVNVWDCCAGSGGKSILAYDVFEKIDLTVSDVRSSIIHNLKERFEKANIKNYKNFVVDVTNSTAKNLHQKFDFIICDAPCSGSGTWSRTPEQLYFFKQEKIKAYTTLQQKIVTNAVKQLKQNAFFLYITCSVFKAENEVVVDMIKNDLHLSLLKMELLKGYDKKADTLFAALFIKHA